MITVAGPGLLKTSNLRDSSLRKKHPLGTGDTTVTESWGLPPRLTLWQLTMQGHWVGGQDWVGRVGDVLRGP